MIRFKEEAMEQMVEDAVNTFPEECCGFLFGTEQGEVRTISRIFIVNNAKEGDRRRRFIISPQDYMRAEALADGNDLQLLGIYHSHPNHPAIASEHDRVAAQPYFSYVIISVMDREPADIRSWQLNDELQFEEETVDHSLTTQIKSIQWQQ